MAEKGLLTKELEALAIKGLDYLVSAKGFAEAATDLVIKAAVPIIDNNILDSVVDDEIKDPIREAGQMIYDGEEDSVVSEKLSEAIAAVTKFEESDTLKQAYVAQITAFICWVKVGLEYKD